MASPGPKPKYNFFLRLDNGAVIGPAHMFGIKEGDPDRPVYLPVHEAFNRGLVGPSTVARLESLVNSARLMAKRQAEGNEVGAPPKKRLRKDTSEPQPPLPEEPSGQPPFYRKCLDILIQVIQDLGKDAEVFEKPVNADLVPDYYTIIKAPMDLGTIKDKLKKGKYSHPKEFAEDMRLVWKNCALYNKRGDFVERLGNRASLSFENQWAMSGFAEEARSKRVTAGLAAPKYDPGPITTKSEKPAKLKEINTEKAHKAKAKTPHHKKSAPASTNAGAKPAASTGEGTPVVAQVPSEVPEKEQQMSLKRMECLATGLSSLDGTVLEEAMNIIKENTSSFEYKEGEEIELDIGSLNNKTLWQLNSFLIAHSVKVGSESPDSRVFINKESDSDTDSSSGTGSDSDSGSD